MPAHYMTIDETIAFVAIGYVIVIAITMKKFGFF